MPADYVKLFQQHHGDGPYPCDFCPELVVRLDRFGYVHHRDGDHDNNELDNLVAAHARCHTQYHVGGQPGPNRGRRWSPETRAKISAALRGRKLSPETRARMSAARQRDREVIAERTRRAWAEGRGRNQWT